MQKIPTIFERDWGAPGPSHPLTDKINPAAAWVFDPEQQVTPTRKVDGTCVMFSGTAWWARREVKAGRPAPANFKPLGEDPVTGKVMGYEPIEQSGWRKMHHEAVLLASDPDACIRLGNKAGLFPASLPFLFGTYELIGPKINGNPESVPEHMLIKHNRLLDLVLPFPVEEYSFVTFFKHMTDPAFTFEGIVFHNADGRMAKIKKKDFSSTTMSLETYAQLENLDGSA